MRLEIFKCTMELMELSHNFTVSLHVLSKSHTLVEVDGIESVLKSFVAAGNIMCCVNDSNNYMEVIVPIKGVDNSAKHSMKLIFLRHNSLCLCFPISYAPIKNNKYKHIKTSSPVHISYLMQDHLIKMDNFFTSLSSIHQNIDFTPLKFEYSL